MGLGYVHPHGGSGYVTKLFLLMVGRVGSVILIQERAMYFTVRREMLARFV